MSQERQQNATCAIVGDLVARLSADAEALFRRIAAPDLAATPLYIVPVSQIKSVLAGPTECLGYTCPSLDLYLRDDIAAGWRGRGPCMVVNDLRYASQDPDDIELDFFAVVLHELAHILERPVLFRERPDTEPALLTFEAIVLARHVQEPLPQLAAKESVHHHGDRFIRAALHLRHRAAMCGISMGAAFICPNRDLDLCSANAYRIALGDEPANLIDASIRDILATPAPEAFNRLWADDLARLSHHSISPKE